MHFVIFLQNLKKDVALLDPQIQEFLKSSDSLLDDSDLPDEDHRMVERESKLLEKRWNKVKDDANSREPRFVNTIKLYQVFKSASQFVHPEKFSLHFSSLSFVTHVNSLCP